MVTTVSLPDLFRRRADRKFHIGETRLPIRLTSNLPLCFIEQFGTKAINTWPNAGTTKLHPITAFPENALRFIRFCQ
jgi:hypothetical protein